MDEKKIMATEEVKDVEVIDETKPKFGTRVKSWFSRNKKKFIIAGLGAAGIAAGVLVKQHKDKLRAEEAEDDAARAELAEEWYQRGLDAGRNALPEATDSETASETDEEES